ncbi:MAG: hypothetical protein AAGA48_09300 [Myxococcota bacterium]
MFRHGTSQLAVLTLYAGLPAACTSPDPGTSPPTGSTASLESGDSGDGMAVATGETGGTQPGDPHLWSVRFGDPNYDAARGLVSAGPDGNVVFTGRFSNDITFGAETLTSPGGSRAFLTALDRDGSPKWARDMNDAFVWELAADRSGNVWVSAQAFTTLNWGDDPSDEISCCQQLVVGQFSSDGTHRFSRGWGDFLPFAALRKSAIAVDDQDAVYLTGSFDRNFVIGGFSLVPVDEEDAWVVKLDPSGNVVWATSLSGTEDESPHSITVNDTGTVYVAGAFGGSVTAGSTTATAATDASLFVARIDSTGTPVDVMGFDTTLYNDVTIVADGVGVLLGGSFEGTLERGLDLGEGPLPLGGDADAFIARFTDQLALDWATSFGLRGDQHVVDLGRNPAGDVWLTGTVGGGVDFGAGELTADNHDLFVARIDTTTHAPDFGVLFGGEDDQTAYGLGFDGAHGAVLLGDGPVGVDFGGGALVSAGASDVYVGKLDLTALTR